MKYLLICLFIVGCGAEKVNYTVFIKEDSSRLYNLEGVDCIESGYQLDKNGNRLITTYLNCDVHKERHLNEFELKQWIPEKVKPLGIQIQ